MDSNAQEEKVKCTNTGVAKKNTHTQRIAKNFDYYFGLAHKTHKLTIKVRLMQNLCPEKLEHFPKSKSTF